MEGVPYLFVYFLCQDGGGGAEAEAALKSAAEAVRAGLWAGAESVLDLVRTYVCRGLQRKSKQFPT